MNSQEEFTYEKRIPLSIGYAPEMLTRVLSCPAMSLVFNPV